MIQKYSTEAFNNLLKLAMSYLGVESSQAQVNRFKFSASQPIIIDQLLYTLLFDKILSINIAVSLLPLVIVVELI